LIEHPVFTQLRSLLWLFAVPLVEILALASMSLGPITAYGFWIGLIITAFLGIRYHDKHNRTEQYEDRLTSERMEQAREWLILKGGEKRRR